MPGSILFEKPVLVARKYFYCLGKGQGFAFEPEVFAGCHNDDEGFAGLSSEVAHAVVVVAESEFEAAGGGCFYTVDGVGIEATEGYKLDLLVAEIGESASDGVLGAADGGYPG